MNNLLKQDLKALSGPSLEIRIQFELLKAHAGRTKFLSTKTICTCPDHPYRHVIIYKDVHQSIKRLKFSTIHIHLKVNVQQIFHYLDP